ncbi:MAG: hypothetical protein J6W49_07140 [Paludibacteraceae bacterium]|nr:hypothetical protein [Paludibacteraceae bacterium]
MIIIAILLIVLAHFSIVMAFKKHKWNQEEKPEALLANLNCYHNINADRILFNQGTEIIIAEDAKHGKIIHAIKTKDPLTGEKVYEMQTIDYSDILCAQPYAKGAADAREQLKNFENEKPEGRVIVNPASLPDYVSYVGILIFPKENRFSQEGVRFITFSSQQYVARLVMGSNGMMFGKTIKQALLSARRIAAHINKQAEKS